MPKKSKLYGGKKKSDKIKEVISKTGEKITKSCLALFCDEHNKFSTTKTMNLAFFVLAFGTGVTGIIAKLVADKMLDTNTYMYVGGITGSGFLQYSYGNHLNKKNNPMP